jgi:AraC family transcriptional regulator
LNGPLDRNPPKARNAPMLLSFDGRARGADRPGERVLQKAHQRQDRSVFDMANPAVEVYPRDIVQRRTFAWEGIAVELLQAPVCEVIEFRFRAPFHLLAVYEHGVRSDGDTRVEGLPPSTLRDVSRKLTFVPAGHEYVERHKPRDITRIAYFYIDPGKMPVAG